MKQVSIAGFAILFVSFANLGFSLGQQPERRDGARPQAGPPHQQAQTIQQHSTGQAQHETPAAQSSERPQSPYGSSYHGGVRPNGGTLGGVHHSGVPQHEGQVRSGFGQSRAHSWKDDHRNWTQRGGYNGYRVPEERVRAYWGKEASVRHLSVAGVIYRRVSALSLRRLLGNIHRSMAGELASELVRER